MSNTDRLLSLLDLAAYASLSRATIRRRHQEGLSHFKLGGRMLVSEREFLDGLRQFRVRPSHDVAAIVDTVMGRLPRGTA